jgi:hypothetical protein
MESAVTTRTAADRTGSPSDTYLVSLNSHYARQMTVQRDADDGFMTSLRGKGMFSLFSALPHSKWGTFHSVTT